MPMDDPALELPAHLVARTAAMAISIERLTFAQLVAMAARLESTMKAAAQARAITDGQFEPEFDDLDPHLACMFALVEAEIERRLAN